MIRPIHPFPARMAPDLALQQLATLPGGASVLDPMAGSGTVVRHATHLGHCAWGFDLDPLAVLMASVWTTPIDLDLAENLVDDLMDQVRSIDPSGVRLPAIDDDPQTTKFVSYWFDEPQCNDLRRVVSVLDEMSAENLNLANLYRVALSRIIITKDRGASLARDVSHSRPHKSWTASDFEVLPAFERSIRRVIQLMRANPPEGCAEVQRGDARKLSGVADSSIDLVLTSPPYLNAIDYMRGHRLSLVWLGHMVGDLRVIRSSSIGAERASDDPILSEQVLRVARAMCPEAALPRATMRMIDRYAGDLVQMLGEVARVLRPGGRAVLVVGDSMLQGTFVQNSAGVSAAATAHGLRALEVATRELPAANRYLPIPKEGTAAALAKRMRTETVLTFAAPP